MVKSSAVSKELRKEREKVKELDASFSQERERFNATIAANRTSSQSLTLDDSKVASSADNALLSGGPLSSLEVLVQGGDTALGPVDPHAAPQMRTLDPSTGIGRGPLSMGNRKTWMGTARTDLKEQTDWQEERAALLEELQRLRPLGDALAQMARDFSTMQRGAASESRVLSPGSYRDADPTHRARPSTSTGNDPAALSYCDMYTQRVARKMKSSAGHDSIRYSGKLNTAKAAVTADIQYTTLSSPSLELGARCCLSGRHATWVALPSISRVSVPLCKKLRCLFGDLIDAENACSQLESDLFCALDELERLSKCQEQEKEREEALVAEGATAPLLEAIQQTAAAVCAVPGGWEYFFDFGIKDQRSSSRSDIGGTRGQDNRSSLPSRNDSQTAHHTRPPPLHLIPVIVSRAIAMARAFSSEVTDKKQQLSTALSDLHDAQARLIAAVEYTDCLTTELAMREKKESIKAEAFICIESNLRDNLERSNSIAHDRQLAIARLTAEVHSHHRL
jgi:hypothetical protein